MEDFDSIDINHEFLKLLIILECSEGRWRHKWTTVDIIKQIKDSWLVKESNRNFANNHVILSLNW